jgi:peptidoglycan lytic transglycosylase
MTRVIVWGIATLIAALAGAANAEEGTASHYDPSSGAKVACGGALDTRALTAAHRTLPCGTRVRVHNKQNGRSVVVTINDRGPHVRGRIIDVTPAAATVLGFNGVARVAVTTE